MLTYYITDRKQLGGDNSLLLDRIAAVAQAGVDFIQLREKDLSAAELEKLAQAAMQRVANTSAKLIINSRTDIAIATGAHGVHLRSDDVSVSVARNICAKAGRADMQVGVSCHTLEEVARAHKDKANYILFAPVFGKDGAGAAGLQSLRMACALAAVPPSIPVLALGGVTIENAADCIANGAAGVAGIRLFQNGSIHDVLNSLRRQ